MAEEGEAVAISVDAEDIGKRLKRSKKRVIWKFCFGAGGMEHTVELKHSTISGKKVVSFDGEDVHQLTNPLTPDFDHTFLVAHHQIRVSATELTHGIAYSLFVDGKAFESLPVEEEF